MAALYSMLQIGFSEFQLEKIWLRVDEDNLKLERVMKKQDLFVKE